MKKIALLLVIISILAGCSCSNKTVDILNYPVPKAGEIKTNLHIKGIYQRLINQQPEQSEIAKLLKLESGDVYYLAANGKRYMFPTQTTFKSWFGDYDVNKIKTLTIEEMYQTQLGGNIFIKPYSLLKTETDNNTYFVDLNGQIRTVNSTVLLNEVYGDKWQEQVIDLPNNIFTNYQYGPIINTYSDFPIIAPNLTIETSQFYVQ